MILYSNCFFFQSYIKFTTLVHIASEAYVIFMMEEEAKYLGPLKGC